METLRAANLDLEAGVLFKPRLRWSKRGTDQLGEFRAIMRQTTWPQPCREQTEARKLD